MSEWRKKSKRKPSGGLRKSTRRCTKKLAWKGRSFAATKIEPGEKPKKTQARARGNNKKVKQKIVTEANIALGKGKIVKGKILNCLENESNRQFVRRNILTKGALIEVEVSGEKKIARVSSRPGQSGSINAVALSEDESQRFKEKSVKPKKSKKEKKPGKEEKGLEGKEALQGKKVIPPLQPMKKS